MRNVLIARVRPLVQRLAEDLTDLAVGRIEAEIERMREAFNVAASAYASDGQPDLITAALGPELAQMLTPRKPKKAPKVRTIGVHPTLGKLGVVERDAKPSNVHVSRGRVDKTALQANGKQPPTCKRCGFVGGNSRGCGTSHETQGKPAKPAASDSDEEPARVAPQRTTRNLQATYDMITRAQAGDQAAMNELVRQNIGLVHWVARRHAWSSVPYEDMIQEGAIGLVEAIRRFDVSLGLRLSTYAPQWIRHFIGRAAENDGLIRLPVHSHQQLRAVRRAQKGAGPEATIGDIAQRAGLGVKAVNRLLERGTVTQPGTLPDVAAPADNDDEEQLAMTRKHVASLPDRQRQVMELRYSGDGMTLLEVGNVLGVSRERVRQIETAAVRAVRSKLDNEQRAHG